MDSNRLRKRPPSDDSTESRKPSAMDKIKKALGRRKRDDTTETDTRDTRDDTTQSSTIARGPTMSGANGGSSLSDNTKRTIENTSANTGLPRRDRIEQLRNGNDHVYDKPRRAVTTDTTADTDDTTTRWPTTDTDRSVDTDTNAWPASRDPRRAVSPRRTPVPRPPAPDEGYESDDGKSLRTSPSRLSAESASLREPYSDTYPDTDISASDWSPPAVTLLDSTAPVITADEVNHTEDGTTVIRFAPGLEGKRTMGVNLPNGKRIEVDYHYEGGTHYLSTRDMNSSVSARPRANLPRRAPRPQSNQHDSTSRTDYSASKRQSAPDTDRSDYTDYTDYARRRPTPESSAPQSDYTAPAPATSEGGYETTAPTDRSRDSPPAPGMREREPKRVKWSEPETAPITSTQDSSPSLPPTTAPSPTTDTTTTAPSNPPNPGGLRTYHSDPVKNGYISERYDDPVYFNLAGRIPTGDDTRDGTLDDWVKSYLDTNANRDDPEEPNKSAMRGFSQLGEVTQALTRKYGVDVNESPETLEELSQLATSLVDKYNLDRRTAERSALESSIPFNESAFDRTFDRTIDPILHDRDFTIGSTHLARPPSGTEQSNISLAESLANGGNYWNQMPVEDTLSLVRGDRQARNGKLGRFVHNVADLAASAQTMRGQGGEGRGEEVVDTDETRINGAAVRGAGMGDYTREADYLYDEWEKWRRDAEAAGGRGRG